jgi:hypothetical protein
VNKNEPHDIGHDKTLYKIKCELCECFRPSFEGAFVFSTLGTAATVMGLNI